jgi:WD40 repeat protein
MDSTIQIWNANTKAVQRVLSGHKGPVYTVAFSRDGTVLASSSTDKTIFVWSHHTGQIIKTLEGHGDVVQSVAFSRDDKMLISGSYDKSVRIWDVQTGKLHRILEGHTNRVTCVVVSGHSQVASCGEDSTIRFTADYLSFMACKALQSLKHAPASTSSLNIQRWGHAALLLLKQ